MKIALTGGAGFIASHIADAYLKAGHEVVVIDDLSSGRRENLNSAARFVHMDITHDDIHAVFEEERFDVVNHHAAQIEVRVSVREPKRDAMVNVIGSLNLMEAAVKTGVSKFIFASSAGTVYGHQYVEQCDESQPMYPLSPYGVAKLSIERYLQAFKTCYGLSWTALRYANVFGPRQNPHGEAGVIAIFLEKLLQGHEPIIFGDGLQTRDYVFVEDVVRANLRALDAEVVGAYNIASGRETNVLQILEQLNQECGTHVQARFEEAKPGEPRRGCYSYALAEQEMQWRPEISFEEGIRRFVHYRKHSNG